MIFFYVLKYTYNVSCDKSLVCGGDVVARGTFLNPFFYACGSFYIKNKTTPNSPQILNEELCFCGDQSHMGRISTLKIFFRGNLQMLHTPLQFSHAFENEVLITGSAL